MDNFLLFGRSRSGTTITFKILNRHSEIKIVNQAKNYLDAAFSGGNKMGTPTLHELKLLSENKKFKFIHIYRDGRDSVASGMRMNKVFGSEYRPWKDIDPKINSKNWADAIFRWEYAKSFISNEKRIDIRFEDYLDFPGKNSRLISNLLEIDKNELKIIERELINPAKSNRGYYKTHIPNWKSVLHPDALKALKLLGYIN